MMVSKPKWTFFKLLEMKTIDAVDIFLQSVREKRQFSEMIKKVRISSLKTNGFNLDRSPLFCQRLAINTRASKIARTVYVCVCVCVVNALVLWMDKIYISYTGIALLRHSPCAYTCVFLFHTVQMCVLL